MVVALYRASACKHTQSDTCNMNMINKQNMLRIRHGVLSTHKARYTEFVNNKECIN